MLQELKLDNFTISLLNFIACDKQSISLLMKITFLFLLNDLVCPFKKSTDSKNIIQFIIVAITFLS